MNKVLFLIFSLFSSHCFAFTLSNSIAATFPENDVRVNVANLSCDNIGVSAEKLLELSQIAVDRFWNTVPTSRLRLEKGSMVNVAAAFKTDAVCPTTGSFCTPNPDLIHSQDIIIACNNDTTDNFTSNGTLAVAVPNNIRGEDIVGAVVLINDTATTRVDDLTEDQLISTIAHEIGHAIGLGHSKEAFNLMYFSTSTDQFYLGEDDVDGITFLYGTSQPFSGCGTISTDSSKDGPGTMLFLMSFILVTMGFQATKLFKKV